MVAFLKATSLEHEIPEELTANAPEASDTRFTPTLFAEGCNADLVDGIGNLANRILSREF
jgi:methionyl-tRNA synthetase